MHESKNEFIADTDASSSSESESSDPEFRDFVDHPPVPSSFGRLIKKPMRMDL